MNKTHPLFYEIYEAAVQGDISALHRIYIENKTLDVWCNGDHTPSSRLAAEGKHDAIANLRQFSINTHWIAYGLARGGYIAAALEFVTNDEANIYWVTYALAWEGYLAAAQECVTKHEAPIDAVASGLARRGCSREALEYVANHGININLVAMEFAIGGHIDAALHCVAMYGARINQIARSFACGGYIANALDCTTNRGAGIEQVGEGLALGGYVIDALSYVQNGRANIPSIATNLAQAGYIQVALECVHNCGADTSRVTRGLSQGGHFIAALEFMAENNIYPRHVVNGMLDGMFLKSKKTIYWVLQQCSNKQLRDEMISFMDSNNNILNQSSKITWLIENQELNFNSAYEWITNHALRSMLLNVRSKNNIFMNSDIYFLFCEKLSSGRLTNQEIRILHAKVKSIVTGKNTLYYASLKKFFGVKPECTYRFFDKLAMDILVDRRNYSMMEGLIIMIHEIINDYDEPTSKLDKDDNYYPILKEALRRINPKGNYAEFRAIKEELCLIEITRNCYQRKAPRQPPQP